MTYRVIFSMDNNTNMESTIEIKKPIDFLNDVFKTKQYTIGGNPVLCIITSKITGISIAKEKI